MQKLFLFLLLISFNLHSRQLYIWMDKIEDKLFYFDRETETLVGHSLVNSANEISASKVGNVVYVSNYVAADYFYHKEGGIRGGYALLDVRDGSYREIEAADLVDGHFSTFGVDREKSRKYLLLGLVNVEYFEVTTEPHQVDFFKWDPNNESSPIPISYNEYENLVDAHNVRYDSFLGVISNKSGIKNKYTNADHVFFYNGNMEVWSHEEKRYYVLRSIPDFEAKNIEYFVRLGRTQIKDSYRIYRPIHFISVDGFRSVPVAR